MNFRSSAWTGRAHRTLQAAFGPYTSADVRPMRMSTPWSDRRIAGIALALVIGAAFVALVLAELGAL